MKIENEIISSVIAAVKELLKTVFKGKNRKYKWE
jgi:hypothetical protein